MVSWLRGRDAMASWQCFQRENRNTEAITIGFCNSNGMSSATKSTSVLFAQWIDSESNASWPICNDCMYGFFSLSVLSFVCLCNRTMVVCGFNKKASFNNNNVCMKIGIYWQKCRKIDTNTRKTKVNRHWYLALIKMRNNYARQNNFRLSSHFGRFLLCRLCAQWVTLIFSFPFCLFIALFFSPLLRLCWLCACISNECHFQIQIHTKNADSIWFLFLHRKKKQFTSRSKVEKAIMPIIVSVSNGIEEYMLWIFKLYRKLDTNTHTCGPTDRPTVRINCTRSQIKIEQWAKLKR